MYICIPYLEIYHILLYDANYLGNIILDWGNDICLVCGGFMWGLVESSGHGGG